MSRRDDDQVGDGKRTRLPSYSRWPAIVGFVFLAIVAVAIYYATKPPRSADLPDVFEFEAKVAEVSKKGGNAGHYLYEHEGKEFRGEGVVAEFRHGERDDYADVTITSHNGQRAWFYYRKPDDFHKKPNPLAVGNAVKFRCKVVELHGQFGKRPALSIVALGNE